MMLGLLLTVASSQKQKQKSAGGGKKSGKVNTPTPSTISSCPFSPDIQPDYANSRTEIKERNIHRASCFLDHLSIFDQDLTETRYALKYKLLIHEKIK